MILFGRCRFLNESKKAVREYMLCIAAGFAVYIPLVCAAFALAKRFSAAVLFGAVYGSAVMLLYNLLFALSTAKAASESEPEAAKKRIQASYSLRMLILVVFIGAGLFFSTDYAPKAVFHWLPIIISLLVPRLAIAAWQIRTKLRQSDGDGKKGDDSVGN